MPIDEKSICQQIDNLLELSQGQATPEKIAELMGGTITIMETVYGSNSQKCKHWLAELNCYKRGSTGTAWLLDRQRSETVGVLKSVKTDLSAGLVANLARQAQGEVFGDFIVLAKDVLDDNKDVAAVLGCAALEDALKRAAIQEGLDVQDKDMSTVINALISNGKLKGPQGRVVKGHIKLRDKAFHAEWDQIDKPSVSSAIAFTEQFVLENFV